MVTTKKLTEVRVEIWLWSHHNSNRLVKFPMTSGYHGNRNKIKLVQQWGNFSWQPGGYDCYVTVQQVWFNRVTETHWPVRWTRCVQCPASLGRSAWRRTWGGSSGDFPESLEPSASVTCQKITPMVINYFTNQSSKCTYTVTVYALNHILQW